MPYSLNTVSFIIQIKGHQNYCPTQYNLFYIRKQINSKTRNFCRLPFHEKIISSFLNSFILVRNKNEYIDKKRKGTDLDQIYPHQLQKHRTKRILNNQKRNISIILRITKNVRHNKQDDKKGRCVVNFWKPIPKVEKNNHSISQLFDINLLNLFHLHKLA